MISQAPTTLSMAANSPPPPASRLPQRRSQHSNNTTSTLDRDPHETANNHQTLNNNLQMERVTFHLHSRLCNFGLSHTTSRTRNLLETLLLVVAICCACALLMLHRTFVIKATTQGTCLDSMQGFDPASADLTHLVILPHNLTTISDRTTTEPKSMVLWSKGTRKGQRIGECSANGSESSLSDACSSASIPPTSDDTSSIAHHEKWLQEKLLSNTLPISYSYSTTKAYLMLPNDHSWLKHDLDVQYVLVAPNDPACFGEPFVQFLLWNCFIGGNTVLLNWLLTFQAHEQTSAIQQQRQPSTGYVYNPRTQWLEEFSGDRLQQTTTIQNQNRIFSKWKKLLAKIGVFLRTSFLFFFCTTLVSFTLRETQERMLNFTRELSRRVRQSLSLSDLITTHVVQNLVFVPIMLGMMFFLIEFYDGDKFLAFSISSIVWSVEGFSLISLRSSQGLQYFPNFFFLLFLLFHVYQTAFPTHGFVYLALTVVWCFMLHSMVFFWHRYELPALVLGHVSIHRPRMILQQRSNEDDELQYTNNSSISRNDLHRAPTIGASNTTENPEPNDAMHRTSVASIEGSHLTAPLLAPAQTTAATSNPSMARNSSSSANGGGPLSSHQSFISMSTSSRRTSGLYRLNQEDENSTGSHLYFLGGEVVVHQQRTNHGSNTQNNRGNSTSAAQPPTATIGAPTDDVLDSTFIRNESAFSLLSATSDGIGSTGLPRNNSNNAIGLDVTGRWSGEPEDNDVSITPNPSSFHDSAYNDTSMETVQVSDMLTPQHAQRRSVSDAVVDATSDGYYAHESGGLQAIFESKLTPRHRNTGHPDTTRVSTTNGASSSQQRQSTIPSSSFPTQPSEIHYQRRPPTFPELSRSDREDRARRQS